MDQTMDIKKLTNVIFSKRGHPAIKNFPLEFSDGSKLIFFLNFYYL